MWNVYGVWCDTWNQACEVAGIETPAQLEAEDRYWFGEECVQIQDEMEARGGPLPRSYIAMTRNPSIAFDDEIPF